MINDQPGPELDAKVSRLLFGIIPPIPTLPEYSTTWSGMQLVVEEMQRRNWWIVLNSEGDKWSALFYWDPNAEAFEEESDTAPHAVALAAIAVLEGQVDG